MTVKTNIAPPPWKLRGEGYILVYRFSKRDLQYRNILDEADLSHFSGGFGAVMVVDYKTSPVGPYKEILFIPGKFREKAGKGYRVTKIAVSTLVSVVSGRANWGLPKNHAQFQFINERKGKETVSVTAKGINYFRATFKPFGPFLPLSGALLSSTLLQDYLGRIFLTRIKARGEVKVAKLSSLHIDPKLFPPIRDKRPLLVLKVTDFEMLFPEAEITMKEPLTQEPAL